MATVLRAPWRLACVLLCLAPCRANLYEYDPEVEVLTYDTFAKVHTESETWIVEFYADWCGQCQTLHPFVVEMAKKTSDLGICEARFAVVSCEDHQQICNEQGVGEYPAFRVYEDDSESGETGDDLTAQEAADVVSDGFSDYLSGGTTACDAPVYTITNTSLADLGNVSSCTEGGCNTLGDTWRNPVPVVDLVTSLTQMLKQQILSGVMGDLSPVEKSSLENFLRELSLYFPGAENRAALKQLLTTTEQASAVNRGMWTTAIESMTGGDFNESIARLESTGWEMCLGSTKYTRGYPCGLWLLFHTLAINAPPAEAATVATAIRGAIEHFYRCTLCSTHFLKYSGDISLFDTTADPDVLVFWIWEAHNHVNDALHVNSSVLVDSATDPEFPKQHYPGTDLCEECYDGADLTKHKKDELLVFLAKMYCQTTDILSARCAKFGTKPYGAPPPTGIFGAGEGEVVTDASGASYVASSSLLLLLLGSLLLLLPSLD